MRESMARRLFQVVEPVALVTYMEPEPTDALLALGLPTVWDAHFAGRARGSPSCRCRSRIG